MKQGFCSQTIKGYENGVSLCSRP